MDKCTLCQNRDQEICKYCAISIEELFEELDAETQRIQEENARMIRKGLYTLIR